MFTKKYRTLDLIVGRIVYVKDIENEGLGRKNVHYKRIKKWLIVKKLDSYNYEIVTTNDKLRTVDDFSLDVGDVALEIIAPLVSYGRFPDILSEKNISQIEQDLNRRFTSKDAEITK